MVTKSFEQALHYFIISPSNAINAISNVLMKGGYVKQCGVRHVTIESIVYSATMVLSCSVILPLLLLMLYLGSLCVEQ